MRVLMVSETYYPLIGGIPDHIYHLSSELRKNGHDVKVLTASFKTDHTPEIPDPDVFRVGHGIAVRANKSFARVTMGSQLAKRVNRFMAGFDPDIVHVHGSLAPTLPLLALQCSKAKNIATFHAGHRKSIGYLVFKPWLSSYFRKLHGLIAVSEAAEISMSKYFRGNYRIIPNGVDTDGFHPSVEPIKAFRNKRKKILYMNRLEPKKGLPHLVKALRIIKREIPDVQAIIAGSGPFEGYYKAMVDSSIADNVVFVGAVPALPVSLRASYYCTCDLYCAPSIGHESFGIVLLEAMACQKPLIASHIDGYKEVLEHKKEGLFFQRKDDESLAAAALKILKDPGLAEKMGKAGRIKALQHSWPRVTRQVEEFYGEILDS